MYERVMLTKEEIGFSSRVKLWREKDISIKDELILHMRAYIYKEQKVHVVEYPTSWWQHLKKSFPKWWLARWPIVNTKVEVNFDILYPNFVPLDKDVVIKIRRKE